MEKINLLDYDTIILDLDNTVWHGSNDGIWAKTLASPLYFVGKRITDSLGEFLEMSDSIEYTLKILSSANKNIGFITRGGLLNVDYEDQPAVKCLKIFGILGYFKYKNFVLHKDDKKSRVFSPLGKTIFIDDNPIDTSDILNNFPDSRVLNRTEFDSWKNVL